MIADKLYYLRTKSGESQETVANAIGITRVAYTRYENGTRIPKADIIAKLARHFSVTVESILGYEQEESIPEQAGEQLTLSALEQKLISNYRSLNKQGKEYILQTMDMAVKIYKEYTGVSNMEAAE